MISAGSNTMCSLNLSFDPSSFIVPSSCISTRDHVVDWEYKKMTQVVRFRHFFAFQDRSYTSLLRRTISLMCQHCIMNLLKVNDNINFFVEMFYVAVESICDTSRPYKIALIKGEKRTALFFIVL